MDGKAIEAERLDIQRRMDENRESGGSLEEHDALLQRWEELTDRSAQVNRQATSSGKDVAAQLKAKQGLIDQLGVERPGEGVVERGERLDRQQHQRQLAAELERHAPYAGRSAEMLEAELLETRAAREDARAGMSSHPSESAHAELAQRRLKELDSAIGNLRLELQNRENYSRAVGARNRLIASTATREATEEHRRRQAEAVAEALTALQQRDIQPWELEKVRAAAREPVPQSLIDAKLRDVASRPKFVNWTEG